ncbi:single-strand DNA-binding protein [Flavobacterium araucananum]|uniref:Single-stranded DNA-binding protein n=1 Tax=Flavobacterium araucananum TaxID=946678 RepID=A0A227P1W3_9FLAO|nr:single-stranded DNA-binding protein [Flavobacterium araucananum]OXG03672.1 single-stranded DNA-binding protein [Flavobacterium araucananum]PWJ96737.1 single-strand DNA-binding protein [Flavobacterium araucananum]
MEITGRLTADAVVQKVNNDKQVVNFSIAINDNYKTKGSTEVKEVTTYINCSYWLNTATAQWLKKGTLVQLFGRIGMNVYNNSEGEAVGTLTFHTNNIKILVFPKKAESTEANSAVKEKKAKKTADVPF